MKRKLKLRKWVKILLIIIIFLILLNIIKILIKEDENFMKGCMRNYSYNYCISHK